jgi:hypothetical protein
VIVYAVVDDALSPELPLGVESRGVHPPRGRRELAAKLRIEERELKASGLN